MILLKFIQLILIKVSRLEILRNSIWDIKSFDGVESGLWRILLADEAHNFTIMYPINDSKRKNGLFWSISMPSNMP